MNQQFAQRFIPMAREIANTSFTVETFRHVSIVIQNKSIEAIGTNQKKTHTLPNKYGYYGNVMHSELAAFSKLRYRDSNLNFVLLNFRFNRDGELRLSRPCKYCIGWCLEFFSEIWYSDNESNMVKLNDKI